MNAIQRADAYFNDWNTHDTDACKNNVPAAELFGHALNTSRNAAAES